MTQLRYDQDIVDQLKSAFDQKVQGEHEAAITVLEQIILNLPECHEAFEELGDNYLSLRKIDQARKALQHAVSIKPDSSNAHYLLGFLHSLKEDWQQSVVCLQTADSIAPNHPEILRCLGWAVYNANRQSQGISILERSCNLSPHDVNILCDLGVCYMNSFDHQRAEEIFKKALALDPHSEQARECLEMLQKVKASQ